MTYTVRLPHLYWWDLWNRRMGEGVWERVLAEIVSLAVDLGIELRDVLTADEIVRAARSLSAAKSTESTQ